MTPAARLMMAAELTDDAPELGEALETGTRDSGQVARPAVREHLGQPRKGDGLDAVDRDSVMGRRLNLHMGKAPGQKPHQVVVLGTTTANQQAARVGCMSLDRVLAGPGGELCEAGLHILSRQGR